jgi:hypothetical protein
MALLANLRLVLKGLPGKKTSLLGPFKIYKEKSVVNMAREGRTINLQGSILLNFNFPKRNKAYIYKLSGASLIKL